MRLYLDDQGADAVRSLAAKEHIACSLHGRIECVAAFHRGYRERHLSRASYLAVLNQFEDDDESGGFTWLPVDLGVTKRVNAVYRKASPGLFLRAADALHLGCAAENSFKEVHSHDQRMLAAVAYFGLKGKNVIK